MADLKETKECPENRQSDEDAPARPGRQAGLLDTVPLDLPALRQCQGISTLAAGAGFEWESVDDVWEQVRGEVSEFLAEPRGSSAAKMEFGDILFALVNVARWEGVDAEDALLASCGKFRRRWSFMEDAAHTSGRSIEDVPNAEQEALWAQAKLKETEL